MKLPTFNSPIDIVGFLFPFIWPVSKCVCLTHADVIWMDIILFTTVKVSKHKLGPFDHTQSMFKQPAGLVYIGNNTNYLLYLLDPFPRGLEVDLEGSSIFPALIL